MLSVTDIYIVLTFRSLSSSIIFNVQKVEWPSLGFCDRQRQQCSELPFVKPSMYVNVCKYLYDMIEEQLYSLPMCMAVIALAVQ